jgi:uncharacterized protein
MQWLFTYRWWLLGLVAMMFAAGFPWAQKAIKPNNSVGIWFNKHDPALMDYFEFQRSFGNDRIIVLGFKDDKGILQPATLQSIKAFTDRLLNIEGIKEVGSVLNARDFRRIKDSGVTRIRLTHYFDDSIHFRLSLKESEQLMESPLIAGRFINKAGTVAMLTIMLDSLHLVENRVENIIPAIEAAASPYPGKHNIHLGGTDIVNDGLNKLSQRDFRIFAGLGFLLMFIIVGLFYRRFIYLVLVILVCTLSVFAALAVHGFMGMQLHIFTVICPPLLITLGIIAVMHIINEYDHLRQNQPDGSPDALTIQALQHIFKPAMYASLTTIVGFASLYTSPTAALREFSLLSTLGTLFLFGFSFLFSIILLPMQRKVRSGKKEITGEKLSALAAHILRHAALYSVICVVTLLVAVLGTTYIKNDLEIISYFPKNHKVVKDNDYMMEQWGPYFPIDMVLTTNDSFDLRSAPLLQSLVNFNKEIGSLAVVENSFDFTHVMDRYMQVSRRKSLEDVLEDPFQSILFIDPFMEKLREQPNGIISPDLRKARLRFTGPLLSVRKLENNLVPVEAAAKRHFGKMATLNVSGYPALYIKVMNYAFASMKSGLYTAIILVFLSILLMVRSLRTALIAMAPNIFPVVLLLGFLGYSQINLDLATCTVTTIVMGIAIDDTIYFLHKYRLAKASGMDTLQSICHTHHTVGKVILLSSLVMFAGFSVMLMASLKTVIYFGLLSMVAVVAAIIGDLLVLPLLLKYADDSKPGKKG